MKPTLIFISHLGLQHIQKQKNSKRVGYKILKFCLHYNRMTQLENGRVKTKEHVTRASVVPTIQGYEHNIVCSLLACNAASVLFSPTLYFTVIT